jgi:hypothetical protein
MFRSLHSIFYFIIPKAKNECVKLAVVLYLAVLTTHRPPLVTIQGAFQRQTELVLALFQFCDNYLLFAGTPGTSPSEVAGRTQGALQACLYILK